MRKNWLMSFTGIATTLASGARTLQRLRHVLDEQRLCRAGFP
ncbi:MAG TPA: hypothetical protein VIT43_12820 [Candidatus Dormibacteraeota bacterium]